MPSQWNDPFCRPTDIAVAGHCQLSTWRRHNDLLYLTWVHGRNDAIDDVTGIRMGGGDRPGVSERTTLIL